MVIPEFLISLSITSWKCPNTWLKTNPFWLLEHQHIFLNWTTLWHWMEQADKQIVSLVAEKIILQIRQLSWNGGKVLFSFIYYKRYCCFLNIIPERFKKSCALVKYTCCDIIFFGTCKPNEVDSFPLISAWFSFTSRTKSSSYIFELL